MMEIIHYNTKTHQVSDSVLDVIFILNILSGYS